MLERYVASALASILSDYIQDVSADNLKLSLWAGVAHLHNIWFRRDALDRFGLPFSLQYGYIGEISIQIPWSAIYTQPCRIIFNKVSLVLEVQQGNDWSQARDLQNIWKMNEECVALLLKRTQKNTGTQSSGVGMVASTLAFVSRLAQAIRENIELQIYDVMVSLKCERSVFGFHIEHASWLKTSNVCPEGIPVVQTSHGTERVLHLREILSFIGPGPEKTKLFMPDERSFKEDAESYFESLREVAPKYSASAFSDCYLHVGEAHCKSVATLKLNTCRWSFTKSQWKCILQLLAWCNSDPRRELDSFLPIQRPCIESCPRSGWKYAANLIFKGKHVAHKRIFLNAIKEEYEQVYRDHIIGMLKKTNEDLSLPDVITRPKTIRLLERELSLSEVLSSRKTVYKILLREISAQDPRLLSPLNNEVSSTGRKQSWSEWWYGEKVFEQDGATAEEIAEIRHIVDDLNSPNASDGTVDEFSGSLFEIITSEVSVHIESDKNYQLEIEMSELGFTRDIKYNEEISAWRLDLKAFSFEVSNIIWASCVANQDIMYSSEITNPPVQKCVSNSLLSLKSSTSDSRGPHFISVLSSPVHTKYSWCIKNLCCILSPGMFDWANDVLVYCSSHGIDRNKHAIRNCLGPKVQQMNSDIDFDGLFQSTRIILCTDRSQNLNKFSHWVTMEMDSISMGKIREINNPEQPRKHVLDLDSSSPNKSLLVCGATVKCLFSEGEVCLLRKFSFTIQYVRAYETLKDDPRLILTFKDNLSICLKKKNLIEIREQIGLWAGHITYDTQKPIPRRAGDHLTLLFEFSAIEAEMTSHEANYSVLVVKPMVSYSRKLISGSISSLQLLSSKPEIILQSCNDYFKLSDVKYDPAFGNHSQTNLFARSFYMVLAPKVVSFLEELWDIFLLFYSEQAVDITCATTDKGSPSQGGVSSGTLDDENDLAIKIDEMVIDLPHSSTSGSEILNVLLSIKSRKFCTAVKRFPNVNDFQSSLAQLTGEIEVQGIECCANNDFSAAQFLIKCPLLRCFFGVQHRITEFGVLNDIPTLHLEFGACEFEIADILNTAVIHAVRSEVLLETWNRLISIPSRIFIDNIVSVAVEGDPMQLNISLKEVSINVSSASCNDYVISIRNMQMYSAPFVNFYQTIEKKDAFLECVMDHFLIQWKAKDDPILIFSESGWQWERTCTAVSRNTIQVYLGKVEVGHIDELMEFYETFFHHALCLRKCDQSEEVLNDLFYSTSVDTKSTNLGVESYFHSCWTVDFRVGKTTFLYRTSRFVLADSKHRFTWDNGLSKILNFRHTASDSSLQIGDFVMSTSSHDILCKANFTLRRFKFQSEVQNPSIQWREQPSLRLSADFVFLQMIFYECSSSLWRSFLSFFTAEVDKSNPDEIMRHVKKGHLSCSNLSYLQSETFSKDPFLRFTCCKFCLHFPEIGERGKNRSDLSRSREESNESLVSELASQNAQNASVSISGAEALLLGSPILQMHSSGVFNVKLITESLFSFPVRAALLASAYHWCWLSQLPHITLRLNSDQYTTLIGGNFFPCDSFGAPRRNENSFSMHFFQTALMNLNQYSLHFLAISCIMELGGDSKNSLELQLHDLIASKGIDSVVPLSGQDGEILIRKIVLCTVHGGGGGGGGEEEGVVYTSGSPEIQHLLRASSDTGSDDFLESLEINQLSSCASGSSMEADKQSTFPSNCFHLAYSAKQWRLQLHHLEFYLDLNELRHLIHDVTRFMEINPFRTDLTVGLLLENRVTQLSCNAIVSPSQVLLIVEEYLLDYVLDLASHTLEITRDSRTFSSTQAIILPDFTRLRVKNGKIKIPYATSINDFVRLGKHSMLHVDEASVSYEFEETKLPDLNKETNDTTFLSPLNGFVEVKINIVFPMSSPKCWSSMLEMQVECSKESLSAVDYTSFSWKMRFSSNKDLSTSTQCVRGSIENNNVILHLPKIRGNLNLENVYATLESMGVSNLRSPEVFNGSPSFLDTELVSTIRAWFKNTKKRFQVFVQGLNISLFLSDISLLNFTVGSLEIKGEHKNICLLLKQTDFSSSSHQTGILEPILENLELCYTKVSETHSTYHRVEVENCAIVINPITWHRLMNLPGRILNRKLVSSQLTLVNHTRDIFSIELDSAEKRCESFTLEAAQLVNTTLSSSSDRIYFAVEGSKDQKQVIRVRQNGYQLYFPFLCYITWSLDQIMVRFMHIYLYYFPIDDAKKRYNSLHELAEQKPALIKCENRSSHSLVLNKTVILVPSNSFITIPHQLENQIQPSLLHTGGSSTTENALCESKSVIFCNNLIKKNGSATLRFHRENTSDVFLLANWETNRHEECFAISHLIFYEPIYIVNSLPVPLRLSLLSLQPALTFISEEGLVASHCDDSWENKNTVEIVVESGKKYRIDEIHPSQELKLHLKVEQVELYELRTQCATTQLTLPCTSSQACPPVCLKLKDEVNANCGYRELLFSADFAILNHTNLPLQVRFRTHASSSKHVYILHALSTRPQISGMRYHDDLQCCASILNSKVSSSWFHVQSMLVPKVVALSSAQKDSVHVTCSLETVSDSQTRILHISAPRVVRNYTDSDMTFTYTMKGAVTEKHIKFFSKASTPVYHNFGENCKIKCSCASFSEGRTFSLEDQHRISRTLCKTPFFTRTNEIFGTEVVNILPITHWKTLWLVNWTNQSFKLGHILQETVLGHAFCSETLSVGEQRVTRIEICDNIASLVLHSSCSFEIPLEKPFAREWGAVSSFESCNGENNAHHVSYRLLQENGVFVLFLRENEENAHITEEKSSVKCEYLIKGGSVSLIDPRLLREHALIYLKNMFHGISWFNRRSHGILHIGNILIENHLQVKPAFDLILCTSNQSKAPFLVAFWEDGSWLQWQDTMTFRKIHMCFSPFALRLTDYWVYAMSSYLLQLIRGDSISSLSTLYESSFEVSFAKLHNVLHSVENTECDDCFFCLPSRLACEEFRIGNVSVLFSFQYEKYDVKETERFPFMISIPPLKELQLRIEGIELRGLSDYHKRLAQRLIFAYSNAIQGNLGAAVYHYMKNIPVFGVPLQIFSAISDAAASTIQEPIATPSHLVELTGSISGGLLQSVSDLSRALAAGLEIPLPTIRSGAHSPSISRNNDSVLPGEHLLREMVHGVSDVVRKPSLSSLIGVVTKPVGGLFQEVSTITGSLASSLRMELKSSRYSRQRGQRPFSSSGTVLPLSTAISIIENQRFYPSIGWSSELLPGDPPNWALPSGSSSSRESLENLFRKEGRILGSWLIQGSDNCRMWWYARDFAEESHPIRTSRDHTRYRIWYSLEVDKSKNCALS